MMGEGFPFDLVLIAMIAGILGGVNRAKRERTAQDIRIAEERRQARLQREMEDHANTTDL